MQPDRSYPIPATPIRVYEFSELESTNSFLKSHLDTYPAWSAIRAVTQTAGRGRADRSWKSLPDKDLSISFAIPLNTLQTDQWPLITLTAALSVCETLEFFGLRPKIKWPNDVLVDGAKICGILTETSIGSGDSIAVLGIGINVFSTANELQVFERAATSMVDKKAEPPSIGILIETLGRLLHFHLETLMLRSFSALTPLYNARMDRDANIRTFVDGTRTISGRIIEIQSDGCLCIELRNGTQTTLSAGEIVA